jgi:hypothetical protein
MICPHCGGHIDETREKEYAAKTPIKKENEYYEFALTVGLIREKAILFNDGTDEFWIPISQMRYPAGNISDLAVGQTVTVEIADWIAKQKGLMDKPEEYKAPDVGTGPIKSLADKNDDDIPF